MPPLFLNEHCCGEPNIPRCGSQGFWSIINPMENIPSSTNQIFIQWQFPEYEQRVRPKWWWLLAIVVWLALVIWAALAQHSFLYLLILLFAAIIFITLERREPQSLTCSITDEGVEVDDHLYLFDDLETFFIIYQPPQIKNLYLIRKSWRPILAIPLHNQNPSEVKKVLAPRLKEELERTEEPFLDQLARLLGLH